MNQVAIGTGTMPDLLLRRVLNILDRVQPNLRHIPAVTHSEIEEVRAAIRDEERADRINNAEAATVLAVLQAFDAFIGRPIPTHLQIAYTSASHTLLKSLQAGGWNLARNAESGLLEVFRQNV